MTLVELKRQFLEYLATDQGRSDKTIENYNRYLKRFFEFVKVKKPSDLTEKHLKEFRSYLSQQPGAKHKRRVAPMKQSTQNYYLIAVRVFLKFLAERGATTLSHKQIKLAQVPEHTPTVISASELKRLMNAPNTKELEGKRDKAILELLLSTGLRISELTRLSLADIDVTQDEFSVSGTGGITRVVTLSKAARKALGEYIKNRSDRDNALFIRYGRKMNDGGDLRLSPRAVQRLLKKYAVEVGITQNVTPQIIRHHFAANLMKSGASLQSAQALLGHTHRASTQVYTKVVDKS